MTEGRPGWRALYRVGFARYARLADRVARASLVVTYGLLLVVSSVTLLAVFYRYVLNDPIQWAEEASRYILIWMTLIGASVAIKERRHVNLTSIVDRLPTRVAVAIELVLYLIVVALIGLIVRESAAMIVTRSLRVFSASLQIPMAWAHAALPVGFGLILLQSGYIVLEDIGRLLAPESESRRNGG